MLGVNEADAHMLKQVELTHYYFLKWDDVTLAIDNINSLLVDNLVRFVDLSKRTQILYFFHIRSFCIFLFSCPG